MSRDELVEDLAYVRALAEEGRHAPLLGGAFLMLWGALNAIAYLLHWSLLQDFAPDLPGGGFPLLWMTYGVVAGIGMALLSARMRNAPGHMSAANRMHSAIWGGVGLALFAIVAGCIGRMIYEHDPLAPNGIMGPALACFGAAQMATARISGQAWMRWTAMLSFIAGAFVGVVSNEPWAYLAASAASVIVLFAPGLALVLREPSTTV